MKTLFLIFLYGLTTLLPEQIKTPVDDGRTINIPVIFHVISSGNNQTINNYVTPQLLQKQIDELNANYNASNDMSLLHPDYTATVGNPNIQFYMADIEGTNGEKGVFRTGTRSNHNKHESIDPSKYLNICIGDFGTVTQMSGPNNHKVHINYQNIGDGGNTVTHELGHYFGLWHVWGQSNCKRIKLFSGKDDYISDTPTQKNCTDLSRKEPCPETLNVKNFNANNFMDYSGCRVMFTLEQANKMRNSIINDRPEMFRNSLEE